MSQAEKKNIGKTASVLRAVAVGAAASVQEAMVPGVPPVPEPGTLMLPAVGTPGMARYRHRVQ